MSLTDKCESIGSRLREARERVDRTTSEISEATKISHSGVEEIESGHSEIEHWGPILGAIAVCFGRPTSRLMSSSGKHTDIVHGQCGGLIKSTREELNIPTSKVVDSIPNFTADEYRQIESGLSNLEVWGPKLLLFANVLEQPIFNFIIGVEMKPLSP